MPPKPAAPAEAGSKQVKPKQKKAPAPKKTQPIDDIDCTAGKFSAAGSAECDDCAAGKFSATIGAIKAKAVDYKSTIEAQWNTAAWRGKGHEEFDLQQVQKRAYFKGLQAPAVLSVASPSSSSSSSVSYGYGEFRRHRLLLTRHIDQKDRKRAPCYDQAKADVADIAAGDKTFRSDVDLAS